MKALTLWRPWPYAIFYPPPDVAKRVENRSWRPPDDLIGQRIACHAGKTWDADGKDFIGEHLADVGALAKLKAQPGHDARVKAEGLIGTVLLCGVCDGYLDEPRLIAGRWPATAGTIERVVHDWYVGRYGWLLDDARALPEPIPCKGQRGLWDVPAELIERLA